jgi:hypothetical protein
MIRKRALVAIFFSASVAFAQEGAPAPKMKIDSFVHDFGVVKPGEKLSYSFKVRNEGSADLIIQSVSPG